MVKALPVDETRRVRARQLRCSGAHAMELLAKASTSQHLVHPFSCLASANSAGSSNGTHNGA